MQMGFRHTARRVRTTGQADAIAMSNPFYDPGQHRAAKVNDLFAIIARRYDLLNDVQSAGLHRLWKRRLVCLAQVTPGAQALDVCCGTGDIAVRLARAGAAVTGLDFSEAMLAVAREKIRNPKSEIRNLRFVRGDAQQLAFDDAAFDIVTVGYGLRNLASWETGLREMARVAKPGGRLLILDFGKPANPIWRGLYFAHLRLVVPVLGRLFAGSAEAYAYILESLRHYPAQLGVAAKMQELGLADVQTLDFLGGAMCIHRAVK
jgi:demethylmenaquinone methyltransferase/2-methoxy-6-polyprenyl-1,4-benzoquinol methylase